MKQGHHHPSIYHGDNVQFRGGPTGGRNDGLTDGQADALILVDGQTDGRTKFLLLGEEQHFRL